MEDLAGVSMRAAAAPHGDLSSQTPLRTVACHKGKGREQLPALGKGVIICRLAAGVGDEGTQNSTLDTQSPSLPGWTVSFKGLIKTLLGPRREWGGSMSCLQESTAFGWEGIVGQHFPWLLGEQ